MDINLPISAYYPKDDSLFIDPLYFPYQKREIPLDNKGCYAQHNQRSVIGNPNYVNKDHYRMDWNMDFKRIHPNDPCPAGFLPVGDGMCSAIREETHDSSFYTDKMYSVRNQYFDGYSVGVRQTCDGMDYPTFSNGSLNPFTGNYVVYHKPKPKTVSEKYSMTPLRHSYLGY